MPPDETVKIVKSMEKDMKYEADMLNFEQAAVLRDKIKEIKKYLGK